MSELLATSPQAILVAFVLAVAIDLVRRLLLVVARGAKRFWNGPEAEGSRTAWYAEIASYLLFLPLAFIGFVPPLVIIVATAALMGLPPDVKLSALAHGMVLLWALTGIFLWLQVWHLMGLPGFWKRVRYLLLLLALPLLMQILTWLILHFAVHFRLAGLEHLRLASRFGHLFSLGVFPFLVPLVHHRVLAPILGFAMEQTARRWRPAMTAIGWVVLVGFVAAIFFWFGQAGRLSPFS